MKEIKLTKTQKKLMTYWQSEIMAMQNQITGMIRMLSTEIISSMRDNFADELKVDLDKYVFNLQSMSFKERESPKKEKQDETKN